MYTLTVDDRELVVNSVLQIMNKLDPQGQHLGATSVSEALSIAEESPLDLAFLDVEMPGKTNGLTLGKQLKQRFPMINIIVITGHQDYAIDAFSIDASGYLLKPITSEAVSHQLSVLRFNINEPTTKKIRINCFGPFEAFYNDVPLDFSYSKSKELLACLVDRRGALCSNDTLIGCLWPDEPVDQQTKARLRKYVKDIKDTFTKIGFPNTICHKERIGIGLDISTIECDYFRFLQGDPIAVHQFKGQYMTQYSFAEETRGNLLNQI